MSRTLRLARLFDLLNLEKGHLFVLYAYVSGYPRDHKTSSTSNSFAVLQRYPGVLHGGKLELHPINAIPIVMDFKWRFCHDSIKTAEVLLDVFISM